VIKHKEYSWKKRKPDTVMKVEREEELLSFLLDHLPEGRNIVKALLTHRQVLVEGQAVTQYNHVLRPGAEVCIQWDIIRDSGKRWEITRIYEDQWLLVIEKPAGLLSIATDTEKEVTAYRMAMEMVRQENEQGRVFVVHRLDRETSGLMMLAKDQQTKLLLQEHWREMVTERAYLAVVEGQLTPAEGRIVSWLKETPTRLVYSSTQPGEGQEAATNYKVLQSSSKYSLLELHLETGRKHQIRVHMRDAGHSIAGDKKYGAATDPIRRVALHAHILAFRHPRTEELLHFETAAPKNFLKLLRL
jgi:23S rRNA pseudouridine1911/1915/1917 synthase